MSGAANDRPIRVGVVGIGRGQSFARGAAAAGMELVALCDIWEEKLLQVGKQYGVATYTDYGRFLEHDMDAVVLANYFYQHAPFAIKALEAGKHVMSETAACKTIAEGVALVRAVEHSGCIYMFAENYPYMVINQEMRRLYQANEIGEVLYAEGEYNHPMDERTRLSIAPGLQHWRNLLPSTYYCTHALAPLMCTTDTMPVMVNALSIADPAPDRHRVRVTDPGSVILCRMDNGAVVRLMGIVMPGHSVYYRLHGTRGTMENPRLMQGNPYAQQYVRVTHEPWDMRSGEHEETIYRAEYPERHEEAMAAGHGGGDFWTNFHFAEAIRRGEQPYLNVYRGVAMTVVGILAWKSALENGAPYAVPDFASEAARALHAQDDWSPWPEDRRPGQPWPSIRGEIVPSSEAVAHARQVWAEMGYPVD
ncbi:MAG: Gfo/Idh/MocA family protein [Anaerolineae bacterium]